MQLRDFWTRHVVVDVFLRFCFLLLLLLGLYRTSRRREGASAVRERLDRCLGRKGVKRKRDGENVQFAFFLFRFGRWLFLLSWKLFVARIIWKKRSDFFFSQFLPTLANPPSLTSLPLLLDNPTQKNQHLLRNLPPLGLQREMPCVHKLHHRPRQVALERFRARREENRIVLAPNRQQGHLR